MFYLHGTVRMLVCFLKCLAAVRWASSLICAGSFVIGALHEEQLIVCKIKK